MVRVVIEKVKEGYVFSAYPSHNDNQPLGGSVKVFKTEAEANKARKAFISLVRTHNLQKEDGKLVRIEERNQKFYFQYYDEGGECIFQRSLGYEQKINCEKGIAYVFDAVNGV